MELKPRLIDRAALALATGLYLSYIPVTFSRRFLGAAKWTGAGLIGTLEGLILLPLLPQGGTALAACLLAAFGVSAWLCTRAEALLGGHDSPQIVLDEIVGFWTAAAYLPRTAGVLAAAFLLFRLFDARKPGPIRHLERLPGGLGIVADDVGAGLLANLLVRAAGWAWPGLMA